MRDKEKNQYDHHSTNAKYSISNHLSKQTSLSTFLYCCDIKLHMPHNLALLNYSFNFCMQLKKCICKTEVIVLAP